MLTGLNNKNSKDGHVNSQAEGTALFYLIKSYKCHSAIYARGEAVVVWNVRTLMDIGSQAIIIHTISKYRMGIICLHQIHLFNFECRAVTIPGSNFIGVEEINSM